MWFVRKASIFVLLAALVTPSVFAENVTTTDEMYLKVRAVGEKLKCQCASQCSYTVAGCNMLHCSFREKVNPEIKAGLEAGLQPETIIENLIAKFGSALRTAPQAEGFGLFGWAMPFAALLAGLIIAPVVVLRWRAKHPATATAQTSGGVLAKYRDQIEREVDELE